MHEALGSVPGPMAIHLYRPAAWPADGPIVAVLHGAQRNAAGYRDAWVPHAEAGGFLLVCPEFDRTAFPGERWYNFGNVVDAGDAPQPPGAWTFAVLDHAVTAARGACGGTRPGFALYGHSAGAQFVHRSLLLAGLAAATRIVIANAGWYSMPRFDVAFPYGLGGTAATAQGLGAALGRPVTLLLGEADTDPDHPALRRDAESDAQGINRFDRGHAFFAEATAAARTLGVPFGWTLATVPGIGHSNAGMAVAAAPILAAG